MRPRARKQGVVVRQLGSEVIAYDLDRHQAHCLNQTAGRVFRAADGRRSLSDLASLFEMDGRDAEDVVALALEQLAEARLIEGGVPAVVPREVSRRAAIRRVGLATAVLLPLVTTMLAPTPAEAAVTCVGSCAGQTDGTPCDCLDPTPPCDYQCMTEVCVGSPGGPC